MHGEVVKVEAGHYYVKCDKCGYIYKRPPNQILRGCGCGVCAGRVVAKGINDIPTTDPWMVKFFQGGAEEASNYTKGSSKKINPVCPFCGKVRNEPILISKLYARRGFSCSCSDGISIPNKIIYEIMVQSKQNNQILSFEKEHMEKDRDGRRRKFDMLFYSLDNTPYFVEMDGGFHGSIILKHRNEKDIPEEVFYADFVKDEIAEKKNIKLIRIDCFKSDLEYIKNNIYESELSKIIDLDTIDWNKVGESAMTNLMREICDYRNQHPEVFASDLEKIFPITKQIVRKYWKKGAKLNLCDYIPEEETKRKNVTLQANKRDLYVVNLWTMEEYSFDSHLDFFKESKNILNGDTMDKHKFDKLFSKTDKPYAFYDNGEDDFLIWK